VCGRFRLRGNNLERGTEGVGLASARGKLTHVIGGVLASAIEGRFGRAILLISDECEPSRSMHKEASRRGFRLLFSQRPPNVENDSCLETLHAVVPVIGSGVRQLRQTFALVHQVARVRARNTRFEPILAVVALADLAPSIRVDFLRLGCQVLLRPDPEQLFHLLETMAVENERRLRKGVRLVRRESLPPVVVHQGLVAELDLRGRPRRLLQTLLSANREFDTSELAAEMGCDRSQVKIYVQRLRREFFTAARQIGLRVTQDEVIRNSGKGTGYRLHVDLE
jgi:hypothetical protein